MRKAERLLKFIIVYKAFMGLLEMTVAAGFLTFFDGEHSALSFNAIAVNLNLDQDNQLIQSTIEHAGTLASSTVVLIALFVFFVGIINSIEAVGLHFRYKWAEWLTVAATGIFIPFELYSVLSSITALNVMILVLNIVVVYYIGKHKELFGKKARMRRVGI